MADTEDSENDSPDGGGGVGVEEVEETAADGGDGPARPDRPAVVACSGGNERNDDATGEQETGDWEDVESGLRRLFEPNRGEVEGNVVQRTKENKALEKSTSIGGKRAPTAKQLRPQKRLPRPIALPNNTHGNTEHTHHHGRDDLRRRPLKLHTSPAHANQETRQPPNKQKPAQPIHPCKLAPQARPLSRQLDIARNQHQAQRAKRQVDVEAPAPECLLDKQPPNQGPQHTSQRPRSQHQRKVLWPLSQRHNIRKNNLSHSNNPPTANPLHRPPRKKDSKILRNRGAQNGAEGEEQDRKDEHLLPAKDVRQGGDEGLAHGAGQEVGCPCPEGVCCRPAEVDGEGGEDGHEDGCVEGDHEGDDCEGDHDGVFLLSWFPLELLLEGEAVVGVFASLEGGGGGGGVVPGSGHYC